MVVMIASLAKGKWYASPQKKTTLSFAIIGLSFW